MYLFLTNANTASKVAEGVVILPTSGDNVMNQYDVAVVMHIDEELSDSEIHQLEHDLSFSPGIRSACINERTRHLMVVDYDPQQAYSCDILNTVRHRGYHAELIGL
jgi:hypothetical protein